MNEFSTWPTYLKKSLPDWLESIMYSTSGVGDLEDLKFYVATSENSKWVGFVNTGWFYHNYKEQYNYVLENRTYATSVASTICTITSPVSFRPSWGPILVENASGQPYTQHANSLKPAQSLAWYRVGSTDFFYCNIPVSAFVVGLRDYGDLPLGAVVASALVIGPRFYYYDFVGQKVIIKPKDSSNIGVFVDLLYSYPSLKMFELIVPDKQKLTLSYNPPDGIDGLMFSRGTETYSYSSVQATNVFTNPLSAKDGQWVLAEYYIPRSFILEDHKTVKAWTSATSGESLTVRSEGSIPTVLNSIYTAQSSSFNLNPMFPDSFRAGYLFHSLPASGLSNYWKPGKWYHSLDKDQIIGSFRETVKYKLTLYDVNGLPIPYYPVTLSYTSTASVLVKHPLTNTTDGRGEIHVLLRPASALGVFTVTATVGTTSKTVSSFVNTLGTVITPNSFNYGRVNLLISDELSSSNSFISYVGVTTLDGIPVPSSGAVSLQSQKSSVFSVEGKQSNKTASIITTNSVDNLSCISKFSYAPQPEDILTATNITAQSPKEIVE